MMRARGRLGRYTEGQVWRIPQKEESGFDCQGTGQPLKNLKQERGMDRSSFEHIILAVSERVNLEG